MERYAISQSVRATLSVAAPQSTMHRLWSRVDETIVGLHVLNALSTSTGVGWMV